jgi:hypothetical protein
MRDERLENHGHNRFEDGRWIADFQPWCPACRAAKAKVAVAVENAADDAAFGPLTESENRLMDGNR